MSDEKRDDGELVLIPVSLRDYFAGQAMQAVAGAIAKMEDFGIITHRPNDVAQIAYVYADAMLEARK